MHKNNKVRAESETSENIESEMNKNNKYHIDNMSLDEIKEMTELRKCGFESKLENKYDIESQIGVTFIHLNKVDKLYECNLIHDIPNPPKHTKNLNSHYSPILQVCMNARTGKTKFKNFRDLLYSGCSSTIAMGRLIQKLNSEEDDLMQWHTQAGRITANLKVKIDFTLS